MYKLVISDDEGATTVVPLVRDEITIGRKEGNTIRLTERNVSRNHARLVKRNGSYVIEDLGSYNGVKINGARIDEDAELRSGDRVHIGDYQIAFEAQNEVLSRSSAPPPPVDAGAPPARLVMVGEPAPGAEFSLNKERLRVGRDEHLDIWIDHSSISREHAEIQVAEERITIFDLDSANGMRINGVETKRASLQSDDTIELGDVAFRFLPSAMTHSFDTAALPATAPSQPARKSSSIAPLLFAGLGVVALAYGAYTFLSGGETATVREDPEATPTAVTSAEVGEASQNQAENASAQVAEPTADIEPVQDDAPTGAQLEEEVMFAAALDACERAVEQGRWEDALRYATRALALQPDTERATGCRASSLAGLDMQAKLDKARSALAAKRVDDAWRMASALPADSVLRKSAEFAEIRDAYFQERVTSANQALKRGDTARAAQQAKLALEVPELSRRQKRSAQRALARATRASKPRPKVAARPKPQPAPKPDPTPEAAKPEPRTGGIDAARECLQRSDNACAIAALEGGRARTPSGLALLIETYRATGNTSAARRHMRSFVRKYPNHGRAAVYARMLEGP